LTLTYNAIHCGEENEIDNRRGMKGFYRSLKTELLLPSCYKVAGGHQEQEEEREESGS
jgi:hypothetical protein